MSRAGKLEGVVVSEQEAAAGLGFSGVEDFRAWQAAGSPTGRCSDPACWWPALWPNVETCKKCGKPVNLDESGQPNL